MIVVNYSIDEIELTLKFYPISKIQLSRLSNDCSKTNISKNTKNQMFYYSFIIEKVEIWMSKLLPYEREIIELRITRKRSFDYISIQFGYANHSSIVRKYNDILKKIYLEEMRNHD
ncbi:hypothetical protein NMU03_01370 [Allocoprobacillus halotolerans]|uniref:Sigma-70 family RNA polymerase sigma factor n=1 Tax=Allocoprobacillus halotolerans TaxID=2944914 RepID=A0ABY5I462_9FIRM|nr:hypothetical protein [Allocoprobacillus halotolerans]UTY39513.1 hypothetical protein NMU03_01370 [Allocoprobacillus halotolerans]